MQELHSLLRAINALPSEERRLQVQRLCQSWKESSQKETEKGWHEQFVHAVGQAGQHLGAEVPFVLLDHAYFSRIVRWGPVWNRAVLLALQARLALKRRGTAAWLGDIPRKPYLFPDMPPLGIHPIESIAIHEAYARFAGLYIQALEIDDDTPKIGAFQTFYRSYCFQIGHNLANNLEWYRHKRAEREIIRAFLAGPPGTPPPSRILVTRYTGGLGDILMMNYGLQELRRKFPGHTVEFLVPAQFLEWVALFEGIVGRDIHGPAVDWSQYSHWYDLSECPAVYEEIYRRPFKTGRIETWCKAMDVSRESAVAHRPTLTPPAEARAQAAAFLAAGSPPRGRKIAIQWASADAERSWLHMLDLSLRLARRHDVFVFHHVPPPPPEKEALEKAGVRIVTGMAAAPLVALLERMDLICGPDSSFTHLAGQMGKPGVGLYGPVDGQVRTVDYPTVAAMDMREKFPCQPCWRIAAIPCVVSGTNDSTCLRDLTPDMVERKIEEMLSQPVASSV